MNKISLRIFKKLLENGIIEKNRDINLWNDYQDEEIRTELEMMKDELNFDLVTAGNSRLYMIPRMDNELFSESSIDFKKQISSNDNNATVNLLYYIGIYLIYLFFHGKGKNLQVIEFIKKCDFIEKLTEHARKYVGENDFSENANNCGKNFKELMNTWLAKTIGEKDEKSVSYQYGCLNKLLIKLDNVEKLFVEMDETIRPTQKMRDLIEFYLDKRQINRINSLLEEVDYATNN